MIGFWQLLIVLVLVLLIFGGTKKFPTIMKDLAKGLRVFKETAIESDDKEDKNYKTLNGENLEQSESTQEK